MGLPPRWMWRSKRLCGRLVARHKAEASSPTCLVVTRHKAALILADQILVMIEGRVAAEGELAGLLEY